MSENKNNVRREFKQVYHWLDANKFRIFKKGITFKLNVVDLREGRDITSTGIGSTEDMTVLMYEMMHDLFKMCEKSGQSAESFAAEVAVKFCKYIEWRNENIKTDEETYRVFGPGEDIDA